MRKTVEETRKIRNAPGRPDIKLNIEMNSASSGNWSETLFLPVWLFQNADVYVFSGFIPVKGHELCTYTYYKC